MLKKLLLFLPLVLPTLIYIGYALLERRRRVSEGGASHPWYENAPWIWLIGSGVALLAVSLFSWVLLGGEPAGTFETPPQLVPFVEGS